MLAVQFIHRSNQEILWNTFCQLPEFIHFSSLEKEQIFKHTLMKMYDYLTKNPFTKHTLLEYNKQTILHFRNWFRQRTEIQKLQDLPKKTEIKEQLFPEQQRTQTSEIKYEFDKRQDEYSQMVKKPDVTKPMQLNSETYEDKIENMEEVLKKYQLERNLIQEHPKIEIEIEKNISENITKNTKITNKTEEKNIWEYIQQLENRISELETQLHKVS